MSVMNYNFDYPIIYFYAKDDKTTSKRLDEAIKIYESLNSEKKQITFDVCRVNKLKFKNRLDSLLVGKNDFELCLLSKKDLGTDIKDINNIMRFCKKKNIKIFDLNRSKYLLD